MSTEYKRVLVILAHADDEFYCVGTLANHAQAGHDVTMFFLSKGEKSSFVGNNKEDTINKRKLLSDNIAELLGCIIRYLDFEDSKIEFNVENTYKIAEVISEIRQHILITWNKFHNIGEGHPDHRNCSDLVNNAVSYARYKNPHSIYEPYRDLINLYMYYHHEQHTGHLVEYVYVCHQADLIKKFLDIYKEAYGNFPVHEEKFAFMGFYDRIVNVRYTEAFEIVTRSSVPVLLY